MNTFELYKFWDSFGCNITGCKTLTAFKSKYRTDITFSIFVDQEIAAKRAEALRIRLFNIASNPIQKEGS